MRHHAGHRQSHARAAALRIVAVVPLRVLHDGLAADFVEGDGLGAFPRGRGQGNQAPHEGRILDAPLQHQHSAHRTADDGGERGQTKVIAEEFLRVHHVADGDEGKREAERPARARVGRRGPAGTLAAAEDVGAEDEKVIRVDRLAGPDEIIPPAGLGIGEGVDAGAVVVAAERVADHDRVVAGGVEPAVGLVPQGEAGQNLAALEGERLRVDKIVRLDEADLAGLGGHDGNVLLRVVHGCNGVNHRWPRMNTDFCVMAGGVCSLREIRVCGHSSPVEPAVPAGSSPPGTAGSTITRRSTRGRRCGPPRTAPPVRDCA